MGQADRSIDNGSFESVLFPGAPPDAALARADDSDPDFFADLNLDQLVEALTASHEEYRLAPLLRLPLREVDAVHYRHEVSRALERDDVRGPVEDFAATMRDVRRHLAQIEKLRHTLQQQAWLLDATALYCEAVESLAAALAGLELDARGLLGLREYVTAYASGEDFRRLAADTRALRRDLDVLEYALHIDGPKVAVERPRGQPDYSAEVTETFAKFAQRATRSYRVQFVDQPGMDQVEERIVERVARLYPDEFRRLAAHTERHRDFLDPTVARFDREVQLYLAYLELVRRLRAGGLPFCYPEVSRSSKETDVVDGFDLVLALKIGADGGDVVPNDLALSGPERVFVVTGPNNGGKTTFARMFGQLHHLAALGLPVPARSARLFLPDRIFTHFEREEDIETLRGKFEDELVRVRAILAEATPSSVIVMNESFASTSLEDARSVGTAVLRRILDLGSLGVYVTFVDELASLGEATVSVVGQVRPDNPAERTFRVVRMPANGLAYAWAIAEKYGLTYERLLKAIPS